MRRRHAPGRRVAAGRAPAVGEPVFPSAAARSPQPVDRRPPSSDSGGAAMHGAARHAGRSPRARPQQPPHRAAHAAQRRHCSIPDTPCGRCHCRRALQQRFMFARLLPPASAQGLMPSRRPLAWAPQPYIEPPARLVRPFFHPPTSSPTPPPLLRSVSAPLPRPGAIPRPQHSSSSRPAARTRRPSVPAHLHPPHPPSTSSWP